MDSQKGRKNVEARDWLDLIADEEEVLLLKDQWAFDELELLSAGMTGLAVPFDAPVDLKKRVFAAAMSLVLGNESIDYTLKKYCDTYQPKRINTAERAIFRALSEAKAHVESLKNEICNFEPENVRPGLLAAEAALIRLPASFQSAGFLARSGLTFEATAVCRLILEQLAWIMAIHQCEDDSYFKVLPTKCITKLKTILPEAGGFYGALSEVAHLHPAHTPHYIAAHSDNRLAIYSRLPHMRWPVVITILRLADWTSVVGEYALFKYLKNPQCWRVDGENLTLESERSFKKIIARFELVAQHLSG